MTDRHAVRGRAVVATLALFLLLAGGFVVHDGSIARADTSPTGQPPQRFTAAQLADPSFHPERGFWDIKGVTRFGVAPAPDEDRALASMGIGRVDASWAAFEPTRRTLPCPAGYDTYDGHCFKPPADVDARIRRFTDAGLPVMAIVFATPSWARGTRPCHPYNSWSDVFCVPDNPADYARFAGYLAHHYDGSAGQGRLTDFVIENEVNLNQWFDTGCGAGVPCDLDSWAADYAAEYNAAYDAIRAVQPHAEVLISLTQHFESVLDRPDDVHPSYSIKTFLPRLVPLLGDRAWQLALHPYPRSVTPTIDARDLPYATLGDPGVVVGWLRATYPDVPSAWNVEFTEQGLNNPGILGDEQAASLCQAFRGVLGTPGVKSFIYHSLRDNLGEFGLFLGLLDSNGVPKEAWATWLEANDPAHPTCGFENAGTTVVRTGVDPATGADWTSSRPLPAGYSMQPRQWRLAYDEAPGTQMAFECGDGDDDANPPTYPTSTWLSLAPDCGGATPMGPVGWITTAPGAGLVELVTCSAGGVRTTTEGTCPSGAGVASLGWAEGEDVPADVLAQANTPSTTTTTVPVDAEHPDLSGYDVVFALDSGSFRIGAVMPVSLPDGDPDSEGRTYLVGTWNRSNGGLELRLLVPSFTTPVQTSILPDPVPITFTMTQVGAGLGSLDPATGEFRLDVTINTGLTSPDPLFAGFLGTACVMGPASLTLRSTAPFDLTATEPVATVAAAGFSFPAAHGCGDNGGLDQVLNPALELPTTDTQATMRFTLMRPAPPEETTTTSGPTTTLVPPVSTTITAVTSTTVTSTTGPATSASPTMVSPTTSWLPGAVTTSTIGTLPPTSSGGGLSSSTTSPVGPATTQQPNSQRPPVAMPAVAVPIRPTYTG